ncbi:S16 family serine protease [Egicoccus sp. AB-alg2]|uniref:S16 family serine protease n=1 Tax=Egicoccus sp. AB-alg2 TaxID=3242693 RepID=UPI00359DF7DD
MTQPRRRMRATKLLILAMLVLLAPVPWVHLVDEDPPGNAWRLDGRLVVEGQVVNPPGRWSWLTVGRPPMVAEVVADRLVDVGHTRNMRTAAGAQRPRVNEPAAVAVGLSRAGIDVDFGLLVEGVGPTEGYLPEQMTITRMNGVDLVDRRAWQRAVAKAESPVIFQSDEGKTYAAPGPLLPFDEIHVVDLAPGDLDAAIGGQLASFAPIGWFRDLALGRSHGLMIALMTYAEVANHDLAHGRHVAGTGGIRGDGAVTRIGGLPAKATAARNRGADVLVFPAVQAHELEDFNPGRMRLLPVDSIDEAIKVLDAASAAKHGYPAY